MILDLTLGSAAAFLPVGLMDRAKRQGVPWSDVTDDADVMMREVADLPATLVCSSLAPRLSRCVLLAALTEPRYLGRRLRPLTRTFK